jgi:flagellar biosynthesis repressor protein FlbT
MTLKLTLKPYERFIVNGCPMRNSGRRHTMVIEEMADVIREKDLLDQKAAVTPVSKAYFLAQTALTRRDLRDKLRPVIQESLAGLAMVFDPPNVGYVFEAANYVSIGDYYKALRALKPVLKHESRLLAGLAGAAEPQARLDPQDSPA